MATSAHTQITERDHAVLEALNRSPLSTGQLLKLSSTFPAPFTAERPLRRRLQRLCATGWTQCHTYHTASRGAPNYYQLTRAGYRLLNGPKSPLPSKRFFSPVSVGLQQHTIALADFLVHTCLGAHRGGATVTHFHRENALRLQVESEQRAPDAAFTLTTAAGEHFHYLVELDGGTEPVQSRRERESCEQKIRFYERYADRVSHRFRVLFVGLRSETRLLHILTLAESLAPNSARRLHYGGLLPDYLNCTDAVQTACFRDHWGQWQSLIPRPIRGRRHEVRKRRQKLAHDAPIW